MRFRIARMMVLSAALVAAIAAPSAAQVSTGRIDAGVVDSTGAVLPGVTVDIAGPQKQSAVTDATERFRRVAGEFLEQEVESLELVTL